MNAVRCSLGRTIIRTYATGNPFVPPQSLHEVQPNLRYRRDNLRDDNSRSRSSKTRPPSSAFYTGRASYYDHLNQIEQAVQTARHALTTLHLLPLPKFARASLVSLPTVWKDRQEMSPVLNTRLTNARYRRATMLLSQLNEYRCIAVTAGCALLAKHIEDILDIFERDNKAAVLARGKTKPVKFDVYGRTYTVGRRKTSSARVWAIRSQNIETPEEPVILAEKKATPTIPATDSTSATTSSGDDLLNPTPVVPKDNEALNSLIGILTPSTPPSSPSIPSSSATKPSSDDPLPITTSSIIINNASLSSYFPLPADRERVVRPLKVAGVLGGFNIFALVRGGGTSGQSGAIALGIAKALAAHEPSVEGILRKAKLMRRDPRMVERKKTGLAKARKRYTWIKR